MNQNDQNRASYLKALEALYGRTTAKVVSGFARGWSTRKIASQFKLTPASVRAYRANWTRGTYRLFV